MKRIGDLMTRDVLAVAPEDTLGEAAQDELAGLRARRGYNYRGATE